MRIGRTLPPAAAPITFPNIVSGISAGFRGGVAVGHFRAELKGYFQVEHCFVVSSGKAALLLILEALKKLHPERDEVLVPALNCFSVPSAIVRAGLKVTLCDIDRETLDFDYTQLRDKLENQRLLCVIPTHLFGRPADIPRLKSMLGDSAVTIVEDAAQAFGGESSGAKLGTLGDVSLFSLGRGKALSTVEGGIILTNRVELAGEIEKIYARLPVCGGLRTIRLGLYAFAISILLRPSLYWLPNSLPFLKLGQTFYDPDFEPFGFSAFQAGLAKGWQSRVAQFNDIRKRHIADLAHFLDELGQLHYGRTQGGIPALIRLPWQVESESLRKRILEKNEQFGLGIAAIYPSSIDQIPSLKKGFLSETYPVADDCVRNLVTLPVHPCVNLGDKSRVEQFLRNMHIHKEARSLWRQEEEVMSRIL
jgi:dTDP-4-amino-4,6-dideoxygalactose transaminase